MSGSNVGVGQLEFGRASAETASPSVVLNLHDLLIVCAQ